MGMTPDSVIYFNAMNDPKYRTASLVTEGDPPEIFFRSLIFYKRVQESAPKLTPKKYKASVRVRSVARSVRSRQSNAVLTRCPIGSYELSKGTINICSKLVY